tara:strand:- start:2927 stop:3181 length:255 start_codon:yes stop_codon:yes gene_type:complete
MTPAPVFGEGGERWSLGSIVRGFWWAFTEDGSEERSIVGTVSRLHELDGFWIVTLDYDGEDVGVGVPFEFPPARIAVLPRTCGL